MRADDLGKFVDTGLFGEAVAGAAGAQPSPRLVVLVVACSALVYAWARSGLPGAFRVVISGSNVGELIDQVLKSRPEAALIDLSCPEALAATCALVAEPFRVPVLVVGARGSDQEIVAAMGAGARGYLEPERVTAEAISEGLTRVAGGHGALSSRALEALSEVCRRVSSKDDVPYLASARLTARQRTVVSLAAAGRSNREIAGQLNLEVSTVKKHLHAAFASLGISDRAQLRSADPDRSPRGQARF